MSSTCPVPRPDHVNNAIQFSLGAYYLFHCLVCFLYNDTIWAMDSSNFVISIMSLPILWSCWTSAQIFLLIGIVSGHLHAACSVARYAFRTTFGTPHRLVARLLDSHQTTSFPVILSGLRINKYIIYTYTHPSSLSVVTIIILPT
ncbi:hypothetical protein BYT27DRAFT_6615740 [Phlegmacium glaucopus]|nr:hypothetical protein BYT27DRAFT_6615740 [Phlegmacium glaucopus]